MLTLYLKRYFMKFLKSINGKALLSLLSIFAVAVLIFFTSFFNATINPEKWGETQFISSLLINTSLCLFGMVASLGFADDFYRKKEGCLFITTYEKYHSTKEKVIPFLDKFSYWIRLLHKKELYEKSIRYLADEFGITQARQILKHLDIEDLKQLNKPYEKTLINGNKLYFKALTDEQIKSIENVLNGKIKVNFLHENYFLNAYNKNSKKTMYEQATNEQGGKARKGAFLISSKILISVATALIFAGLGIDSALGSNVGEMLVNVASRLCVLFGAVYNGFTITSVLVKYDISFIDYKTTTLETFYLEVVQNKTVKCLTEEEEAEQDYFNFIGDKNEQKIVNS